MKARLILMALRSRMHRLKNYAEASYQNEGEESEKEGHRRRKLTHYRLYHRFRPSGPARNAD